MYALSMDAHCKFEYWGIQIYGAIDVHSRHMQWLYVGITGRSAVSVLAQYTATLRHGGVAPLILRSDRGGETLLAADAHYMVRRAAYDAENESLQSRGLPTLPELTFSECYRYGTSKMNQRIEAWWNQQAKALNGWRGYFHSLNARDLYDPDSLPDRLAFLAVYVEIIRAAVMEFAHMWNTHKIRKQSNRPHSIPGIPHVLYHYPELHGAASQGVRVPEAIIETLEQSLEGFGKCLTPARCAAH